MSCDFYNQCQAQSKRLKQLDEREPLVQSVRELYLQFRSVEPVNAQKLQNLLEAVHKLAEWSPA